jgi:hypothetical protein
VDNNTEKQVKAVDVVFIDDAESHSIKISERIFWNI